MVSTATAERNITLWLSLASLGNYHAEPKSLWLTAMTHLISSGELFELHCNYAGCKPLIEVKVNIYCTKGMSIFSSSVAKFKC